MNNRPIILALADDIGSMQAILPVIIELNNDDSLSINVAANKVSGNLLNAHRIEAEYFDRKKKEDSPSGWIASLLERIKPDLVLSGTSPAKGPKPDTLEQLCVLECKKRQIGTVAVLDFWGMYKERFMVSSDRVSKDLLPDILCVMDEHCRLDLIKLGVPSSQILVTQNPWMDHVVAAAKKPPPPSGHTKGIAGFCCLFVSQPLKEMKAYRRCDYDQHDILDSIIEVLPEFTGKNHRILVWKHPGENAETWKKNKVIQRSDVEIRIIEERGAPILAHVDMVASSHSTVFYEALYYGTACLSLRPYGTCNTSMYTDELGLSMLISGKKNLKNFLNDFDSTASRRKLMQIKKQMAIQKLFFSDGKATQRICDIVRQKLF